MTHLLCRLLNDYMFLCASRQTARLAQAAGIQSVYYYQFTRLPPFCPWPDHQKFCCNFVCHGDEMAYVFHDSGPPFPWNFTGIDESLAEAMSNYWASFAMYGDPNKYNQNGVVSWPVYTASNDLSLQLDWPLQAISNLNKENCDMWDDVGYYHLSKLAPTLQRVSEKRGSKGAHSWK